MARADYTEDARRRHYAVRVIGDIIRNNPHLALDSESLRLRIAEHYPWVHERGVRWRQIWDEAVSECLAERKKLAQWNGPPT
jgi:hypothetical protein